MPLPKCNTRSAYKAILYTFGPYAPPDWFKEEARERVFKVFTQYVGRNLKPGREQQTNSGSLMTLRTGDSRSTPRPYFEEPC